jgi:serine/threonine protein kinase
MALASGTRHGPYELEAAIGAGGMGEVYRAKDLSLGRVVAVKVFPPQFTRDTDRRERFEREARAPCPRRIQVEDAGPDLAIVKAAIVSSRTSRSRRSHDWRRRKDDPVAIKRALGAKCGEGKCYRQSIAMGIGSL